jgi:hypothetical protein
MALVSSVLSVVKQASDPLALAPAKAAASTNPQPRKLRLGLFVDTRLQPRWAIEAFAKVAAAGLGELVLIAAADGEPRDAPRDGPLLCRLYGGIDRRAFAAGEDPAERADIAEALAPRKFLDLRAVGKKAGQEAAAAELVACELDVAFALGDFDDATLDGIARYGVWRFYFGAQGESTEASAGWREVAQGAPLSGSGLKVRLARGAAPRLVYQSWSRTYPFSVARNRAQLLHKTAEFAVRALRELQRSGYGWLEQCKPAREARGAGQGLGELQAVKDLSAIGGRIARRGIEKALNVEQWFLAFRFSGERTVTPDLAGFTRLMPPKDRYWADPFVLEKGGRYFVFFEELPFKTRRAHISMIEIDRATGRASPPVRVLERDYHLSYPFLLEHDGRLYMIPETAKNGTVEAYRCIDFPLKWKLERVLLDGVRCVDATFHRGPDRWWMFANAAAPGSRMFDDELHIFHAAQLLGDWQPHARNPVKSDARCARPAGQFFWSKGALYRPAQICAPLYGSGLSINRVLRLTPHEYAERQVERILPSERDGLLGLHTFNRAGELTVVDAFTRRSRISLTSEPQLGENHAQPS